jgi:uncharacterized membrane protein
MKVIGWVFVLLQVAWVGASVYWAVLDGGHALSLVSVAAAAWLLGVLVGGRLSVWALRGRT